MAGIDNVVVDGATRLERVSTVDATARYAEVYCGWKTGNLFDFPSDMSAGTVAETFRTAKPAVVVASV